MFSQKAREERDNRKFFPNALYQKIDIRVLSCGNLRRYFISAVMGDAMYAHVQVRLPSLSPRQEFSALSGLPRTASALCPVPRRKSHPGSLGVGTSILNQSRDGIPSHIVQLDNLRNYVINDSLMFPSKEILTFCLRSRRV